MSNSENSDEWLDAMLSKPTAYIDDDGFTDLVMQALPPVRKRRSWLEPALVLGAAVASSVTAAIFILPDREGLYQTLSALLLSQSQLAMIGFLALLGVGFAALSWCIAESDGRELI